MSTCSFKGKNTSQPSMINVQFGNYSSAYIYYISCRGAFYNQGMILEYENIEDLFLKMTKLQYGDNYKEAYEALLNRFYTYFSKPVTYEEMYEDMINIITT